MAIPYGFTPTSAGRALIAGLLTGETFTISRVMVGSGKPASLEEMAALSDLVEPIAEATSSKPIRSGDTTNLTVEYRSDLNGGLQTGFWLSEFGIFARDGEQEILAFYGCLGEFPQWVGAYTPGVAPDIRRYPCSIPISGGVNVQIDYHAAAFITSEEAAALLADMVQGVGGIQILGITLPAEGWTEAEPGGEEYPWVLDLSLAGVTETQYPSVSIHKESLELSRVAGLCPTVQTLAGNLRFWAREKPLEAMEATAALISPRGGFSGGDAGGLPIATANTLGGVMIGENVNVTSDGKISVKEIPVPAENSEIRDMVAKAFLSD